MHESPTSRTHPVDVDSSSHQSRCAAFSQAWSEGRRATVEEFLGPQLGTDSPEQGNLLARLIQCEVNLRRQSGEAPSAEEYRKRFPALPVETLEEIVSLPTPPLTAEQPPLFPRRYQALGEIGRGGIGSVWRIYDRDLDRVLAAKVLRGRYHHDPGANERLQRECRLTGSLQHPGIPPVHDQGDLLSGSKFFTMKLVDGETLSGLLKCREDSHDERLRYLQIFRQVAETLAYAHDRQVIHRDIKPDNIMVGEFGEVQVMDWGLARRLDELGSTSPQLSQQAAALTSPAPSRIPSVPAGNPSDQSTPATISDCSLTVFGDVLGTPAYMPPEQAKGDLGAMSCRSDVFCLGAMLFEILTGRRLSSQRNAEPSDPLNREQALAHSLASLDDLEIDAELSQLCRHCLEVSPDKRPANAKEVASAVARYLTSVEERLRQIELDRAAEEVARREAAKRQRIKLFFAAIALVAIGAASCAAVWYRYDVARQRRETAQRNAASLVQAMFTAPIESLPAALAQVADVAEYSQPLLQAEFAAPHDDHAKLRAALALGAMGSPQTDYLLDVVTTVDASELPLLLNSLKPQSTRACEQLLLHWRAADAIKLKARLAASALMLGDSRPAIEMYQDRQSADPRMSLIDFFSTWQGTWDPLFELLEQSDSQRVQHAVLASIANLPTVANHSSARDRYAPTLRQLVLKSDQAAIRAPAELALRRWGVELPTVAAQEPADGSQTLYVNSLGMTMVRLTYGDQFYDPISREVSARSIYVSDRETTARQFLLFLDECPEVADRVCRAEGATWVYRPMMVSNLASDHPDVALDDFPADYISPTDAAMFCNWLSEREGLTPYYIDLEPKSARKFYGMSSFEQWDRNYQADGYRLPDKDDFLLMIRSAAAHSSPDAIVEGHNDYHGQYAWCFENTRSTQAVASRLPNLHGLFDVWGNVSEIGDDWLEFTDSQGNKRLRYPVYGTNCDESVEWQRTNQTRVLQRSYWGAGGMKVGFRVARTPSRSLENRQARLADQKTRHESQFPARQLRKEALVARTNDELFEVVQRQMDLGLAKLNATELDFAIECFDDAAWNLRDLISRDYEPVRCRTLLGGTIVNSAICFQEDSRFGESLKLINQAQEELQAALDIAPSDSLAREFYANSKIVRFNTLVGYSRHLSLKMNASTAREPHSLQLALQALDLYEVGAVKLRPISQAQLYHALAAAYAHVDRFEQAIEWMELAVATAPSQHTEWYEDRLDVLKRGLRIR